MTRTSLRRSGGGGFRSAAVVVLLKAIVRPSGDHTGLVAPRGRSVSACASPPDNGSTCTCGSDGPSFFSTTRTNASAFPSGDQRGEVSRVPDVSGRGGWPPAAGTA